MDPAEAQDLIHARALEYPESGSDGEEEEKVPEPIGGEDSGFDASPCQTSGSGALKRARDDMEPEPAKRHRGEGSGAQEVIGDVPRGGDCVLPLGRGGADRPPPPIAIVVVTRSPPTSLAEVIPTRAAARA